MLVVISPAKTLDFVTPPVTEKYSLPEMLSESEKLMKKLRRLDPEKVSNLMGISVKLGELNFTRFQSWRLPFTPENAKQAALAFNGDVYQGLDAAALTEQQFEFAQKHVRILSGLYGLLKPLDLIQPYRLEMGTEFPVNGKKDLYAFWGNKITTKLATALAESGSNVLVNLASAEYFKSINLKKLNPDLVTPEFREYKNGQYSMVSVYAKRARGLMSRFILENEITNPENLKAFDSEGYNFNPRLSAGEKLVFTRETRN